MPAENIHIAGRYNKFVRNLSQSPWIDKDDVRIKDSIQELIEDGLKKYLQCSKMVFSSSGREDVDVRMLGRGRPFSFKFIEPSNIDQFNDDTMKLIQDYINTNHKDKIEIRDLQIVSKDSVSKFLKEGEDSKTKNYRALCCCSRKLTPDDIDRIEKIASDGLDIDQKTPIRVLHRRTISSRRRRIHKIKFDDITNWTDLHLSSITNYSDEEVDRLFVLELLTEAGTYIKEFVHGDFGRTKPNLSSLLTNCDTDLIELDVMEVNLDWPPSLVLNKATSSIAVEQDATNNNDNNDTKDAAGDAKDSLSGQSI